MHAIYQPHVQCTAGFTGVLTITGEEAHHAVRVKRVEVGDGVRVLNGRGGVVEARVEGIRKIKDGGGAAWLMDVRAVLVRVEPRVKPVLHVLTGVPKGDRLEQMVDGLSQVGAARWSPLVSARSVVDPRDGKVERLRRVCEESLKQCGRAWIMEVGDRTGFAHALREAGEYVIADQSGEPYTSRGETATTVLVGPEGGFTPDEVTAARTAGARVCSFGVHTMRVEVAAVAAVSTIMSAAHASLKARPPAEHAQE